MVIEDVVGDANLLNTQFTNVPAAGSGIATPGSQPGLDIIKVELNNTFAPAAKDAGAAGCTGFQTVMTLSGPPAAGSRFRIAGRSDVNNRFFVIAHDSGTKETSIRYGGANEDVTRDLEPAEVKGSTITWTISSTDIRRIGEKRGSAVTLREAATSFSTDGFFLPVFDKALAGGKTFTLCR